MYSDSISKAFLPALGQEETLTVAQAGLNPDSPILAEGITGIEVGDQLECDLLGSLGSTAVITTDGEIQGLQLLETISFAVIDASAGYTRSAVFLYTDKKGEFLAVSNTPNLPFSGSNATILDSTLSSAISKEYLPTLDQFETLNVNFAGLNPASPLNDPSFNFVVIGDQFTTDLLSIEGNAMTLHPDGLVSGVSGDTFNFALWDASGPYTRTAHTGGVVAGLNVDIPVPVGAITLTGFTPSVFTGVNTDIQIPSTSISLTGFAPTIDLGGLTVNINSGTITLTGFTPIIIAGGETWTVQPDAITNWTVQN